MSGTVELKTDRLILRRYLPSDALILHEKFGVDPRMYKYSGWNPYATPGMAEHSVMEAIKNYSNPLFYGWAIESEGALVGTIGAYDYDEEKSQIEIGMSIEPGSWGRGYATEALKAVLSYLIGEENIGTVVAWCAKDNLGSWKALERAGMKITSSESNALEIEGRIYDKLNFSYS